MKFKGEMLVWREIVVDSMTECWEEEDVDLFERVLFGNVAWLSTVGGHQFDVIKSQVCDKYGGEHYKRGVESDYISRVLQ